MSALARSPGELRSPPLPQPSPQAALRHSKAPRRERLAPGGLAAGLDRRLVTAPEASAGGPCARARTAGSRALGGWSRERRVPRCLPGVRRVGGGRCAPRLGEAVLTPACAKGAVSKPGCWEARCCRSQNVWASVRRPLWRRRDMWESALRRAVGLGVMGGLDMCALEDVGPHSFRESRRATEQWCLAGGRTCLPPDVPRQAERQALGCALWCSRCDLFDRRCAGHACRARGAWQSH